MPCSWTKDDGSPCGAPEGLVDDETGYCPAHGPGGSETMSERGRKGAQATAERWQGRKIQDSDLPPLSSPQAAEEWLETVARAVATGKLGHNEGRTVARLVREFLRARHDGDLERRVEFLDAFRRAVMSDPKIRDALQERRPELVRRMEADLGVTDLRERFGLPPAASDA